MKSGKASWTAEITATFRAVESIRPKNERLFVDKYAEFFLRPSIRLILKNRFLTEAVLWFAIERRFPGASTTIVSRIRCIDDCLVKSIKDGIEQLVILGAGYDARAYRFNELKEKHVFEVDHPDTQKLKKEKIINIFGKLPEHVDYVSVDFESDELIPILTEAGYNQNLKTLFIWEGVCKYLTSEAVNTLLHDVSGNACKGSSIVFDYLFQAMIDGSMGSELGDKIIQFQAEKKEPYIFGLPGKHPEQVVLSKGFSSVRNTAAESIGKMYFNQQARDSKMHPFWGIIHAIV